MYPLRFANGRIEMSTPFPPAKLSANHAIGNWLAELCTTKTDEAIDNDAELECLAMHVAREISGAFETGHRVGASATPAPPPSAECVDRALEFCAQRPLCSAGCMSMRGSSGAPAIVAAFASTEVEHALRDAAHWLETSTIVPEQAAGVALAVDILRARARGARG